MTRTNQPRFAAVEKLEGRTLMTTVALNVSEVNYDGGNQLRILGTTGNDQITLKQTTAGLIIGNTGGWNETVTDTINSININAEGGNNSVVLDSSVTMPATIFADTGKNVVHAGGGNDTIVSLGSTADTLIAGAGRDVFWTDNSAAEKIQGLTSADVVHRVSGYINSNTITVSSKKLATTKAVAAATSNIREPAAGAGNTYQSFSSDPIFPNPGPSADDVFQGTIGDCYLLSVFSSVAKVDPFRITSSILDMGDGTVVVAMDKNNKPVFVREDEQLPVNSDGTLAYAGLGQQNCTWVALMEKAYCYVRTNVISYNAIDSGWMDESYQALGANPKSTYSFDNAQDFAAQIGKDLAAGLSVTYATANGVPLGSNLVSDHAYMVSSVTTNSHGDVTAIMLRNPWGCDSDGGGNGYVTVSDAVAFTACVGIDAAAV